MYAILTLAILSYPLSIFMDVSAYNLKRMLTKKAEARYWLSIIYIYQYAARVFMVLFIPAMSIVTEEYGTLDFISSSIVCIQFLAGFLLLLFSIRLNWVDNSALIILRFISYFTGEKNLKESFKLDSNNYSNLSLKMVFKRPLFYASFFSQFLLGFSMTFIYVFSFYFPNNILVLNSITQGLNMVAMTLLLVIIDPKIMSNFDENIAAEEELSLIYRSRGLAHCVVGILFVFF